jgi:hypothetical protein
VMGSISLRQWRSRSPFKSLNGKRSRPTGSF